MQLTVGYLYPDLMNIYGDTGNIITIQKRCQWRGIDIEVKEVLLGDKIKPGEIDLYFFGGGQDQQQNLVAADLKKENNADTIKQDIEKGVPLLSVCGGYQLLGHYYEPQNGPKLPGIKLFPIFTKGSSTRMIGNLVVESSVFSPQSSDSLKADSYLVGFENHSGKTYLMEGGKPFGKVVKGFGNNGEDKTEGCIYKNAIGCYMHGSLLPKNPKLADWLIKKALEIKYGKRIVLKELDDDFENLARTKAIQRFG